MTPGASSLDPRTPVLVGVGACHDPAEPVELMAAALLAAARDAKPASTGALLSSLDRIAVPRGSWGYGDPGRLVAERVGASKAATVLAQLGIPQQTLVNHALEAVRTGRAELVAVVGGEARAWARRAAGEGLPPEIPQTDAQPDELQVPSTDIVAPEEIEIGLVAPVAQYAMIDNALRAAEGRSLADHQSEISSLWARFSAVAAENPAAAFPRRRSPEDLARATPDNRPLAFPYNKWHASQWTVDQAAALLITSVEAARRWSVPLDRWVFPLVALDADHAVPLSRRRHLHRWPAMGELRKTAQEHLRRPLAEVGIIELYSCFPAAVRVQQRELGLPTDGTPTVTGGMAFAGGPLNNFSYQALAAVVPRLRARPGERGAVTTVSGLLTKPGLGVWAAEPVGAPLVADLAEASRRATPTVSVLSRHDGPGTVATYTVVDDGAGPRLLALLDVDREHRVLAASRDPALTAAAVTEEMIGTRLEVRGADLLG